MDGEVFTANRLVMETRGHTYSDRPLAAEILLNMISCGCKADGCGVLCGCRKTGVHSSTLCANCSGQTCNNVAHALLLNEDDNDERSNTDDEDDGQKDYKKWPVPMLKICFISIKMCIDYDFDTFQVHYVTSNRMNIVYDLCIQ